MVIGFAAVEADQGGVDQVLHVHDRGGARSRRRPERCQISVRVAAGSTAWT